MHRGLDVWALSHLKSDRTSLDVRGNSLRKITLTNLFNMKFNLTKTLLAALLMSSAVYAETTYGNSVVYEAGTQLIQEALNVSNTSYDGGLQVQ